MKIRAMIGVILTAVMMLTLASCTSPTTQQPSDGMASTTTLTTVPLIGMDLNGIITAEELTKAVGIPMKDPVVTEQGSGLRSFAVESDKSRVIIDIAEQSLDFFEERVLSAYPDLEVCPNLGESAWFSPSFTQLLMYHNDHMITIELIIEGYHDPNDNLLRCREIAALLLERL